MEQNPWHPRVVPFVVYIVMLSPVSAMKDWWAASYPVMYLLQCLPVAWLLWRYRGLLPELTLSFHWLAVPVGVGVTVVWLWLGKQAIALWPGAFAGEPVPSFFEEMGLVVGWMAFSLRLIGMSVLVPLFEELFIRSLILRSFYRAKPTINGVLHIVQDLPVIGEWLMHTRYGQKIDQEPTYFGREFSRTPLGAMSVFGVFASTVVFTVHHLPRDWAGCVACALAYCWLLWVTRSKGLGPVCWAHGITNGLLWVYTLESGDWQFL